MRRQNQSGFSLIEYSISGLLTMIMLAGTFTLMNGFFVTTAAMEKVMVTQGNIRVAINTIARDISMAGTGLPSGSVEVPNGLNSVAIARPGMAGVDLNTPNDALPFLSPGNDEGPTVSSGTDVLTIFAVNQETPTWTVASVARYSNRYEVTFTQAVNTGAMELFPGDLLLFNNSKGSIMACVSNISGNTLAIFRATDLMGINRVTSFKPSECRE